MIDTSTDTIYRMVGSCVEIDHIGWPVDVYNKEMLKDTIQNLRYHRHLFDSQERYEAIVEIYETALAYLEAHS
jgi:hypothetical protein